MVIGMFQAAVCVAIISLDPMVDSEGYTCSCMYMGFKGLVQAYTPRHYEDRRAGVGRTDSHDAAPYRAAPAILVGASSSHTDPRRFDAGWGVLACAAGAKC